MKRNAKIINDMNIKRQKRLTRAVIGARRANELENKVSSPG